MWQIKWKIIVIPAFNLLFFVCKQRSKELTLELLQYIGGETQYLHSLLSLSAASVSHPRLARVGDALRALVNVIKNNPGKYRGYICKFII